MNKKLMDRELCKLWALQTEESGRSKSLSFKGKDLYITRTKRLIARFLNNKLVFVTTVPGKWTNLHHIWVRASLPKNVTHFYVISFTDHWENIKSYKETLNGYMRRAKRKEREDNLSMCELKMELILNYVEKNSIEPDDEILGYQQTMKNGGLLDKKDREELERQYKKADEKIEKIPADILRFIPKAPLLLFKNYNRNQEILDILDINNKIERHIILEKLENFKSEEEDPWFQKAVDFFMISYHANGTNLFDVLTLEWKYWNNDTISYQRRELHSSTYIYVAVTEKLSQLIMKYANKDKMEDKYIFPFITPNLKKEDLLAEVAIFRKTMNKYLKEISKILGIKKISAYDVRRIWLMEELTYRISDSIPANRDISYSAYKCIHIMSRPTPTTLINKNKKINHGKK